MKLIDVTCPKCKASMKVNNNNKEINCEYCGHKFLIDDETIKVLHIQNGEITQEQEFVNAKTNLNKFKDYEKAFILYNKLSDKYADNADIWIGLLRCVSCDFTKKEYSRDYDEYWKRFTSLADEKEIEKWNDKYDKYMKSFNGYDKLVNKKENGKDHIYVTFFLGLFGVHRFIKKEIGWGLLYLFTAGLYGIGWIVDLVKEVKAHPSSKQKLYNCLGGISIFFGFVYMGYSVFGSLLMIASGILCFKKVTMKIWKEPVRYSKFVKIGLFVLGFFIATSNIADYYGTWYYLSDNETIVELYINNDSYSKVVNGTNEQFVNYDLEENDDFYIMTSNELNFKYDKNSKRFCVINKANICVSDLYKNKTDVTMNRISE